MPPIRMVVVGDDKQFNYFVEQYVQHLDVRPNLQNDRAAFSSRHGRPIEASVTDSKQIAINKG